MSDGIHVAASGMRVAQQRLDAVAHDLANANTAGHRPQRLAFHDLVYGQDGAGAGAGARTLGRGAATGTSQPTGNPLDVVIGGEGFLRVQGPGGEDLLTRAGALQIDSTGMLRTAAGLALVPPVRLPVGTRPGDVAIGTDGAVTVAGREEGRITVVTVAVPEALEARGDGLLAATAASGAPRAADTPLVAGALETSGVDLGSAMTQMMEAQRAFQLAGRAVSAEDELMRIANEVKR